MKIPISSFFFVPWVVNNGFLSFNLKVSALHIYMYIPNKMQRNETKLKKCLHELSLA